MLSPRFQKYFAGLPSEIWEVTWTLFKIMVPTLIVVKIIDEAGGTQLLSTLLSPLMSFVMLPDEMALVWATTILVNIYGGMLIFFTMTDVPLTLAQVTTLGGMMLVAHGLPIEGRIAQKAGTRFGFTLLLRIGGGLLYGALLAHLYDWGEWLQTQAATTWQPQMPDPGIGNWALAQVEALFWIFVVITVLLTFLRFLKLVGIERLIQWILRPFLRAMGIGQNATTITLVGVTLGLSFGGGLLIKEANAGSVSREDTFAAMSFIGVCHSLIEDTLLILLMGAHMTGVLIIRLLFAFVITWLVVKMMSILSEQQKYRFLFTAQLPSNSSELRTK